MRHTFSRVSLRWRVGFAAVGVLAAGVGVLAVSGTASAGSPYKQISITMHPDPAQLYDTHMYSRVEACQLSVEGNEQECVTLPDHGETVYYRSDSWFHGPVKIKATPYSGRTTFEQTFMLCESEADWASLQWWNPMAACVADGLQPALPGIPAEPVLAPLEDSDPVNGE